MKFKLLVAVLGLSLAAPVITPAVAQHRHGGWHGPQHDRWDRGHNRWDRRWDRGHNRWDRGWNRWGPAVGFGLGFGTGVAAGSAACSYAAGSRADRDDAYCSSRFRSYDPASGTYMGYDGKRHSCP
jgi:hypothetical protein